MMSHKNYKLIILTLISFLFTTSFFQNCSLSQFDSGSQVTNSDGALDPFSNYAPQSMSGTQNITNGNIVLKEYRHKLSNRFFYTSRVNDQALLESTYANLFEATGNTITIRAAQEAGLSPVYRLFNKAGYHLYTADSSEQNTALSSSQFRDEGIEGYAIKINPAASCPSPTFSVNRLFHNAQSKYRLVTDTTLKSQLISQGFVDQGILFCATAVSTSAPVVNLTCDFNGTALAHGASVTAYQSTSVPNGSNCISQQRTCSNGNLSGHFQYTTCSVSSPVGGSPCIFGSTTIANGASVTAYQSATSPSCSLISQVRTCTNGNLSGSYSFASCSPPTAPVTCSHQVGRSDYILDGQTNFNTQAINAKMQGSQTYVIELVPGPMMATIGKNPNSVTWNIRSGYSDRQISISPCRGDFTSSEARVINSGATNEGSEGLLNWTVDEPNRKPTTIWTQVNLQPGTRYYINFRNTSCSGTSYGPDTCVMYWFATRSF